MDRAEPPTDRLSEVKKALDEVDRLICDEAAVAKPDRKKSKERARNILIKLHWAIDVMGDAASCYPVAKLVFDMAKGLTKMEMDMAGEQRADCHPVPLYDDVLLDDLLLDRKKLDDHLTDQLERVLKAALCTMEEFGNLANVYYTKCKHPLVRFIKSSDFKEEIQELATRFRGHKKEVELVLTIRTEIRTAEMSVVIEQLARNTERIEELIIARLGEPSNEQEIKAREIVETCGRERVLHDKAKLEEVSTLVGGGKISGNTQALLNADLDDLLKSNMDQFHRKLENSMSQIHDSIAKSTSVILRKLDEGPHEHIDDPDVRSVWQGNGWKLSVKCRHFVDELSNYYEDKFRNELAASNTPRDHWTLPIFSKVMHHPAIGDAIDEDGSGFISVYEINCFLLERPEGWSVPEWLVYWAIGWKINNIKYNDLIIDSLEEIRGKCNTAMERYASDPDMQHHIKRYLSKIRILDTIASWSETARAEHGGASELSHEAGRKLQDLLDHSSKNQIAGLTTRLDELKWILDDPADLPVLLGGSDTRIEQVFVCIVHMFIGRQAEDLDNQEMTDGDWEILTETLDMLIGVFHDRMQALLRGWRAQKLNVDLHISCFAGGIYSGWYSAYYHPNGEMKMLMEKNPGVTRKDSQEAPQANISATMLTQFSNLVERVDYLESQIDGIFSMFKALMDANALSPASGSRETSPSQSYVHVTDPASTNGVNSHSKASSLAFSRRKPAPVFDEFNMISSSRYESPRPLQQELHPTLNPSTASIAPAQNTFLNQGKTAVRHEVVERAKENAQAVAEEYFPSDRMAASSQGQNQRAQVAPKVLGSESMNTNGNELDLIVNGSNMAPDAPVEPTVTVAFPRMPEMEGENPSVKFTRILDSNALADPLASPADLPLQTPRDYNFADVSVADLAQEFITGVIPTDISAGLDMEGMSGVFRLVNPVRPSAWPWSAGILNGGKKGQDEPYFEQRRPTTAPFTSMVAAASMPALKDLGGGEFGTRLSSDQLSALKKTIQHKKSESRGSNGGIKGALKDFGGKTIQKLTLFGSKKSDDKLSSTHTRGSSDAGPGEEAQRSSQQQRLAQRQRQQSSPQSSYLAHLPSTLYSQYPQSPALLQQRTPQSPYSPHSSSAQHPQYPQPPSQIQKQHQRQQQRPDYRAPRERDGAPHSHPSIQKHPEIIGNGYHSLQQHSPVSPYTPPTSGPPNGDGYVPSRPRGPREPSERGKRYEVTLPSQISSATSVMDLRRPKGLGGHMGRPSHEVYATIG